MTRVAIDNVPQLVRPTPVVKAIDEAAELRDRHRLANEELARAQRELEQAQQADVAATAVKIRQGAVPGQLPAAIAKAKDAVELAQRNAAAIGVAAQAAQDDVATAIAAQADVWTIELGEEAEQARNQGRAALAALDDAFARIAQAWSAQAWIAGATSDGRFDRPAPTPHSVVPSSQRRTANSEPLRVDELLGYLREAIDPPTPEPMLADVSAPAVPTRGV